MLSLRLRSQGWCAFTHRPSGLTVDLSFIKNLQGKAVSSLSPAGFAHHRAPATAGLFLPLTPTLRGPAKLSKGSFAPRARQAASPIFRAALVQTSAALRPFHSAALHCKGGETPRLAVATPHLRQEAFGMYVHAAANSTAEAKCNSQRRNHP